MKGCAFIEAREKEILNELISGTKCQFVIPVFQRNYDWRIKDCKRLFEDIIDLAQDTIHPDRKHFMGAFVCKFNKFIDTSFNEYILIDGQQRLTSIILILKVLYDHLGNLGDEYEETRQEIKETYLINKFAKDSNLKLKLKPNKVDNENFIKLMNDEEVDEESTIGRNYNEFKKMISTMSVSINDFYNAIQRLEGVVVFLDESDNPQLIFESLNSTGLELNDVDLIRNFLLMNCKATIQDELYSKYWLKIEQLLDENFLQFIRDYLSLKNGIVTPNTKNVAYTTYQKFYRNSGLDTEEALKDLYEKSKIYKRLIKPTSKNKDLLSALTDYVSLEIKTTYPLVFGLLIDNEPDELGNKNISDDTLAKILRLLETYLIRRNICNLAGGGMSQVMASLYNDLIKKHGENFYKNTYEKVAMALVGISTKAYMPKDDEFIREFSTRDMFHSRNIFYILKRMELINQGKEIINFENLTIEHVMPQTLSLDWKKYLDRDDYEAFHEAYLHRIGNLTLTAYNTEMSNKLYKEKKSHIDFSRLTLNGYFKDIDDWKDEKAINDRAAYLSEITLKLWPYPKVKNIDYIAIESHFLLADDNYDYNGTTPAGISIGTWNKVFDSWTDLYIETLQFIYKEKGSLLISTLLRNDLLNMQTPIISKNNKDLRRSKKLADDYYIEINNNTETKIKIIKFVLNKLQYEAEEVIIFIK